MAASRDIAQSILLALAIISSMMSMVLVCSSSRAMIFGQIG